MISPSRSAAVPSSRVKALSWRHSRRPSRKRVEAGTQREQHPHGDPEHGCERTGRRLAGPVQVGGGCPSGADARRDHRGEQVHPVEAQGEVQDVVVGDRGAGVLLERLSGDDPVLGDDPAGDQQGDDLARRPAS